MIKALLIPVSLIVGVGWGLIASHFVHTYILTPILLTLLVLAGVELWRVR